MSRKALLEKKLKDMVVASQHRMQELSLQLENLSEGYNELFGKLNMTPDQVKDHAENQENYDLPIWEFLQQEKEKIEKSYAHDADSVRDIGRIRQTFSERKSIQQHWIHVR